MHKLFFLGTGGDSVVVGKQVRGAGGIVLLYNDDQYHIDPGPGALAQAKDFGINIRNNIAVICTHNHINHVNDINAVIAAMTLSGLDRNGVILANTTVFNGTEEMLPYLTAYHRGCIEKGIALEMGKRAGINSIEFKAAMAIHSDKNTIGLRITAPEFSIGYTSDTAYFEGIAAEYKDVDILVLNTVHPMGTKDDNNLSADDAIKIISAVKPKLAIITHFGAKMVEADPFVQAREIQKIVGVTVIAAKDGMVIDPQSYSVSWKQKVGSLQV